MVASLSPTETVLAASQGDAVNILLVDDQPSRLLSYRAILGSLNENLIEAHSGTEALKMLMQHDVALILLDVNMPGMDGYETANLIHEHPRFENIPIIFVTAVNLSDLDRMRGYRAGSFDYVMVPIIPEILRSKVVALAELHRKRRELESANRKLAMANDALRTEKARELEALNESLHLANTELANRNQQLQTEVAERMRAETRLLDQDRRKDEFLAILAHELRNPLAAVVNANNAFKLAAAAPHPVHAAMSRQLHLLVRLIDDLLDVARISRGKLTLKREPATLCAVIDGAAEIVAPMLEAGAHALRVQREHADIVLNVDRERLSQVFSNLFSNAAKYSDPGSPIEIAIERGAESVEVAVIDHGIGLRPDEHSRIFELFAQVDRALERAHGGLGIGLTLARHIVEMHDGQLLAHSDGPGCGSRFSVRLPLPTVLHEVAAAPAAAEIGVAAPRRALIVDDNLDSANTLAMILDLLGHTTRCVGDPHQAMAEVEAFAPDLVFLDIGMPGLSGYDIARSLRQHPAGAHVTLVALTGWGQAEDRKRTADLGFDHHLVKPADLAAIQRICARAPTPAV